MRSATRPNSKSDLIEQPVGWVERSEIMQPISDDQILDLAYYIARVGAR